LKLFSLVDLAVIADGVQGVLVAGNNRGIVRVGQRNQPISLIVLINGSRAVGIDRTGQIAVCVVVVGRGVVQPIRNRFSAGSPRRKHTSRF
jgi:hypothetical protein